MRHQGGRCLKEAGDKRGHESSALLQLQHRPHARVIACACLPRCGLFLSPLTRATYPNSSHTSPPSARSSSTSLASLSLAPPRSRAPFSELSLSARLPNHTHSPGPGSLLNAIFVRDTRFRKPRLETEPPGSHRGGVHPERLRLCLPRHVHGVPRPSDRPVT